MAHRTRRRIRETKVPSHHKKRVQEQQAGPDKDKTASGERMNPKYVIALLVGIFVLALFVRVYFSIEIGTEDDGFRMTGGSDPYYHKRVVDYVLEENEHLEFDEMLNYPLGGENPRPPLFDWAMAVVGILFAPLFGGDSATSTWWSVQLLPSVFGALTIFPVYYIAKDALGEKYGLFAAFLFGMMPGAISHSTLGLADHDSYFLFFVTVAFYFYQRSLDFIKDRKYITDWFSPKNIRNGINAFTASNAVAMGYAMMTGFAILAIALAWKGFPYAMLIIFIYFIYQCIISRLKGQDTLGLSLVTIISFGIPLFFSAPYYFTVVSPDWWTSPFYIFFATVVISYLFVSLRDVPWVVAIGSFLAFIGTVFLLMTFVFTSLGEGVSGTGYFLRTKLFDTISEAQAPTFSNVVYSFGPMLFFMALFVGMPYLVYLSFKRDRKCLFFLTAWSFISIYMARSAARFIFNATPIIAILGAWAVYLLVERTDFRSMWTNMRKSKQRGMTNKFANLRRNVNARHVVVALVLVFLILQPAIKGGIDAGIPFEEKKEWDEKWYDSLDSNPVTRVALPDEEDYNVSRYNSLWYLGATGPSYPSDYWLSFFKWLKEQDKGIPDEERPAFISWWDYGFWCIQLGDHPTVADNFQNGYETTGSFITSAGEEEGIAIFIHRTLEGERMKDGLPGNIQAILAKYLENESVANLDDIYDNPLDYKMEDVSQANSILRATRDILLAELDVDGLADLYHDLQTETGKSIRYFAVDSRMFPFEATNNIFYAPTVLSDQTTDKFYDILYVEGNEDGEATGRSYTADELEEAIDANPNLRIIDQDIRYKKPFFDTMFYKAYIGFYGEDVGENIEAGIPGVKGTIGNMQPMPGWMMKHFKLVYSTTYWNPYDQDEVEDHPEDWTAYSQLEASQLVEEKGGSVSPGLKSGVSALKYYDGAILHGVVRTEDGTPVPNARVTVIDDRATPHDSMVTNETGEYELILPFGNITVAVSYGELEDQQSMILMTTANLLNRTQMYVHDYQAMRLRNWDIPRDLVVESGQLSGKIYFDKNNDNDYSEVQDSPISKGYLNLSNNNVPKARYRTEIEGDGSYEFTDIPPGEYTLTYRWRNYSKEVALFAGDNLFLPQTQEQATYTLSKTEDIDIEQAKFRGTLLYANGTLARGVDLVLEDRNNTESYYNRTDEDGRFEFDELVTSRYLLTANLSSGEVLPSFRPDSYQDMKSRDEDHNQNLFTLFEGNTTDKNETFYDMLHVSGKTCYDRAVRPEISIEFYEPSRNILRTVTSDTRGFYEIMLPFGSYRVTSTSLKGTLKSTFYDTLVVTNGSTGVYDIDLQPSYQIRGYMFWDDNNDGEYEIREGIARAFATVVRDNTVDQDIYAGERSHIFVETDGNGGFDLYLPEGSYQFIYADSKSARGITKDFVVEPTDFDDFTWMNASLRTGINLTGTVKRSGWLGNGDGNDRVKNAELRFVDSEGREFVTFSDEEGKYNLTLPGEDLYQVTVSGFGLRDYHEALIVDKDKTKGFELDPLDVIVEGYIYRPDEKKPGKRIPVEGCGVTFTSEQLSTIQFTITEDDGYYALSLPPQEYEVVAKKDLGSFVYQKTDTTTLNFGDARKVQDYTLHKYVVVSGRFTEDGKEINATINFVDSGIFDQDGVEFTHSINTEDGIFETELLPGSYTMTIVMENDEEYVRRITVEENTNFGELDVREEYSWLRGDIFDDKNGDGRQGTGETVGTVKIEFEDVDHGSYIKTSRSSSRFDFLLYNSDYHVRITKAGYQNFTSFLELDMDNSDYDLELIPELPELSGYVWYDYDDDGDFGPREGIRYLEMTIKSRSDQSVTTVTTDTAGRFSLDVRPGDYDIKAVFYEDDGNVKYARTEKNVEVEPARDKVSNLSLEKMYRVSGYTYDAAAMHTIPNMDITVLRTSGTEETTTSSDDNGFYETYLDGDRSYFLYGTGLDRSDARFAVIREIDVGDTAQAVDLNFTEGINVEVVVFNGSHDNARDNGIDIGNVKVVALDYGDLKFTESTNDDGMFTIILPYGNYEFTASKDKTVDEKKLKYVLDETALLGTITNEMTLYLEAEAQLRYGLTLDIPKPGNYNVFRGAAKDFQLEVVNTGNATASVELSTDVPGVSNDYIEVELEVDVFDVKAGKTRIINISVTAKEEAPLGYRAEAVISATVDEDDKIAKDVSLFVVVQKTPLPDLMVKEISVEGQPRIGETYTVSATIENVNAYSSTDPFNVELRVESEVVGTEDGISIQEGETETTVTFEIEAERTKEEIKVIVDSSEIVGETNEDNNDRTMELTVWSAEQVEEGEEATPFFHKFLVVITALVALVLLVVLFVKRKRR